MSLVTIQQGYFWMNKAARGLAREKPLAFTIIVQFQSRNETGV